jgi:hypothetical protein
LFRWPNSARAMTLLGLVLSQIPETRPKARKILTGILFPLPSLYFLFKFANFVQTH